MDMPQYEIGKVVFGSSAKIAAAYERFSAQEIDEVRLAPDRSSPFPLRRRTISKEVSVAGIGTFRGSEKQTLTFAPSTRPGWWIRRMDLPEQLDTFVDIANLWTSAQNLVLRSGSPHNYLRMVEHIVALKTGLGVDDVLLKVNSGDPPLFDQSSLPLVEAMDGAGVVESDTPATFVTVKEPVAFGGNRGDFLLFLPAKPGERNLRVDCAISWDTVIGRQRVLFDVTADTFRYASFARTNATHRQYILAKTVGKLFAATRNWGYNDRNILIHGPKRFYTEPRFEHEGKFLEPVWHRATLDLMAALALTGSDRFAGTVVSYRAGHTLDCDAVRALYRNDLLVEA
ncbi:MAG: UDP-3-O-acyl-N-acetylglucosamine deacetylase [Kiritimatiellae bacterium]|jgi:UDP-3-O-acyl-N-acetylglucosamine deacetylase|nr:UDP-3-O-acyl-N-acetylglucosamine deacetylase [Kiritimatiellia bacterium]